MIDYSNKLILTEVEAEAKDADVYFPKFDKKEWTQELLSEQVEDNIKFKGENDYKKVLEYIGNNFKKRELGL